MTLRSHCAIVGKVNERLEATAAELVWLEATAAELVWLEATAAEVVWLEATAAERVEMAC